MSAILLVLVGFWPGLAGVVVPADPLGKAGSPAQESAAEAEIPDSPESPNGKKPEPRAASGQSKTAPDTKSAGKPDADGENAPDPLERAIQEMRAAQQQLAKRKTGAATREAQQRVIDELAKLIEQAQQPPMPMPDPPPSSSPEQKPQPKPENSEKKPSPSPQPKPMGESSPSSEASSGQSTVRSEAEKAEESSDESREAREREAAAARRREMMKEIWGHLPPALRQKLLNVGDEKSLPRYDELVRRYFESLAEEGTRGASGRRK